MTVEEIKEYCGNKYKATQEYPGKVARGYHCPPVQQPYWNTVYLEDFPDEELLNMIDLAYDMVFQSFSKKVQKQIMEKG